MNENQCECTCHENGVKYQYPTNPPKPCCDCSPLEKTEKEFMDRMRKRNIENQYNSELLAHRIDYLMKEFSRMAGNEKKLWKGCDELDKRIERLELREMEMTVNWWRSIDELKSIINSCMRRMEKLEQLNLKRIEENTLISRRLTDIEQSIANLAHKIVVIDLTQKKAG